MNGYFQDSKGNYSSTRLIGFIVIMYSLLMATAVLIFGHLDGSKVMISATAAGTIFTTIAGPVMFFMFHNKKEEIVKDKPPKE